MIAADGLGPQLVQIDRIAAGGEGIGRLSDGRVFFVHRTAPGDLVDVEIVERHKRWARGRLRRLVEPGPDRRDAPCPFYTECGGCTLEHVTYEAQLRAKSRIVADALERIGGLRCDPPEVIHSPLEFRYRNRVSFALRREGSGRVVAGFHALHDPDRVVDIDARCLLPEEPISRAWATLRAGWGPDACRLPAGERLRLSLRASVRGEISLLVEGGYGAGRAPELLDAVDGLVAIWHRPGPAPATLVAGAPGLPEVWGDDEIELGGTAFLQVNRLAAERLEAHVLAVAGDLGGKRVVDAYCGIGLHARRFARSGAEVVGIELDPQAVHEARRGAPPEARFEQGRVEALLPSHLPADLVVLNPPRAGIAPEVARSLVASPPAHLIYVSCDPATLARDLKRLGEAVAMDGVRCFDLFPQTAHVETVVEMRRTKDRE